jgi:hypothetical protein
MPPQAMLNSVFIVVLTAGLGFIAARYWFLKNQAIAAVKAAEEEARRIKDEHDKLVERVRELESEHKLVKAAVVPITTAFQSLLIKQLTHLHTPVMDALLAKIGPPNTLTEEEAEELKVLLAERVKDMADVIPDSESRAARILPDVMVLAKIEQTDIAQDSMLKIVAVPKGAADDDLPATGPSGGDEQDTP